MKKFKLALMASGRGSNAENLVAYSQKQRVDYEFDCLLSDKENPPAFEKMKAFEIECFSFLNKVDREEKMLKILKKRKIEGLVLAGYMKILSPSFLKNFYDKSLGKYRVINIHPSFLPEFPGRDGYGEAFRAGVAHSGVTVHYVDEGVDTGEIIVQEKFERKHDDQFEDFKRRGLALEHSLYPMAVTETVKKWMEGA